MTRPKTSIAARIGLIFMGLFLALLLLEFFLRIGGLAFQSFQGYNKRVPAPGQDTSIRILCIGESTTAMGGENSYPRQLERILKHYDKNHEYIVINKGIPGKQSTHILRELEIYLDTYAPDLVISMLGINDGRVDVEPVIDSKIAPLLLFVTNCRVVKLANLLLQHYSPSHRGKKHLFGKFLEEKQEFRLGEQSLNNNFELFEKMNRESYSNAENFFLVETENVSNKDQAYFKLGSFYEYHDKDEKAEAMYKIALNFNQDNYLALYSLGRLYAERQKYLMAIDLLQRCIRLQPEFALPYVEIGYAYLANKEYMKARKAILKSLDMDPGNKKALGLLNIIKREMRDLGKAPKSINQEFKRTIRGYNEQTRTNYTTLKHILKKRGIRLVCVQYPGRAIEPLIKMLAPCPECIFVDNEKVFKDVLRKHSYNKYFSDLFAGDFGHCTPEGNTLLATNIARTIMKDWRNDTTWIPPGLKVETVGEFY